MITSSLSVPDRQFLHWKYLMRVGETPPKKLWLKWQSGLTGRNPNEMNSNVKGQRRHDWTNLILCHICLYHFLKVALLLCCSSSQPRFIAPLSRFLPWLWVSLYWTRSFSHGPRSSGDCRLRRMYLMVCCALLYYHAAVWLFFFPFSFIILPLRVSFVLWHS